jgi:outer membrane protein OmpA-like peptidoglycan-associated protein
MKLVSKSLCIAALAVAIGTFASARAEACQTWQEYPAQFSTEARKITPSHALPRFGAPMMEEGELTKVNAVIHFAPASDALTPASRKQLAKVAAILKSPAFHGSHVIVEGHTDAKGKDKANQDLSYRRALRVVHTLVKEFGVRESLLSAEGLGKTKPVATNSTPEGRALNRRVSFVTLGMPCN